MGSVVRPVRWSRRFPKPPGVAVPLLDTFAWMAVRPSSFTRFTLVSLVKPGRASPRHGSPGTRTVAAETDPAHVVVGVAELHGLTLIDVGATALVVDKAPAAVLEDPRRHAHVEQLGPHADQGAPSSMEVVRHAAGREPRRRVDCVPGQQGEELVSQRVRD